MFDFIALAQECAPTISPSTLAALVKVESSFNPFAIGIVNGQLTRQPRNQDEALRAANQLEAGGFNFSLGIAQINKHNLPKYGLDYAKAFTPCDNLRAASKILEDCYSRALILDRNEQQALRASLSCYYSGNFKRGFQKEANDQPSYVDKVVAHAKPAAVSNHHYLVPALSTSIEISALNIKQQQGNVIAHKPEKSGDQSEPPITDSTSLEFASSAVVF